MLAVGAALLIAISLVVETLGYYLRFAGSELGMPSVGYSLHVQAGTLSRVGTMLGLPIIGWLIDSGADVGNILLVPVCTFAVLTAVSVVALLNHERVVELAKVVFRGLAALVGDTPARRPSVEGGYALERRQERILYYAGIGSFLFMGSGFFLAAVFATLYFDYRATILQLSPFVTAVGTFISVVYFDPRISYHVDHGAHQRQVIKIILASRAVAATCLAASAGVWLAYA
jgi:hypothetical protein